MDLSKFIGRPKEEFERATYKLTYEVGASYYDSNGVCIAVAVGNEDSVKMSPVLGNTAYGITHNHIDNGLFSLIDIENFCVTAVREMRVTMPSGKYYSMRKCDDFNPWLYKIFIKEWDLEKERINNNIKIFFESGKVDLGFEYASDMDEKAYDNFVRKSLGWFSEKYGFIFMEGSLV